MKLTARIASLEFRGFFYSPIAWLVLLAFTIPPGVAFADTLEFLQRGQYMGRVMSGLTEFFFADSYWGFLVRVEPYLYLYVPLLTMGLMSRELASGSIKLLYSSPVRVRQIVAGKFLALMGFGFVLVSILGFFAVAAAFCIESLDVSFVLSGLLGLYLLVCAYAAIGLFMSCLTSYQVVAAASTLAVLFALNYVGEVGQQYDFVRDLTYFLSLSGRTRDFTHGLIGSKDLAYFFIVIAMFLGFCVVRLRAGRETASPLVQGLRYAAVLAAALVAGYLTSRPALRCYLDVSATQGRTLSAASQAVLARFHGPVRMTTYVNLLDQLSFQAMPANRNGDLAKFDPYLRFKPDLEASYVYYYNTSQNRYLYQNNPGLNDRQLAERMAATTDMDLNRVLTPEEIGRQVDLAPEENRVVRQLAYEGRHSYLRMFPDMVGYPLESEATAAFKRLLVAPPKVAFLTGHGERRLDRSADTDYHSSTRALTYRYSLINQGFDVITLELKGGSVPSDVNVLVIAGPKQALGADEQPVREFLARGGNLLIAADPGDQPFLNPLLETLGVQLLPQALAQSTNRDQAPDFIFGRLVDGVELFDRRTQVQVAVPGYNQRKILTVKTVAMPGSVGLRDEGGGEFARHPLLTAENVPVALGLTRRIREKEQRVLVIGDADFMSNQEIARQNLEAANLSFTLETFKWLGGGEYPVDTSHPAPKDNKILVAREGIFRLKLLFFAGLPGLTLLGGTWLLVRRRRR